MQYSELVKDVNSEDRGARQRRRQRRQQLLEPRRARRCDFLSRHAPFKLCKKKSNHRSYTVVYAELSLFDIDGSARLHVLQPDAYSVVRHFVY